MDGPVDIGAESISGEGKVEANARSDGEGSLKLSPG